MRLPSVEARTPPPPSLPSRCPHRVRLSPEGLGRPLDRSGLQTSNQTGARVVSAEFPFYGKPSLSKALRWLPVTLVRRPPLGVSGPACSACLSSLHPVSPWDARDAVPGARRPGVKRAEDALPRRGGGCPRGDSSLAQTVMGDLRDFLRGVRGVARTGLRASPRYLGVLRACTSVPCGGQEGGSCYLKKLGNNF